MDREQILDGLYSSFEAYYNVYKEDVEAPYVATAEYHSDDNMYFLIKSAKLSESNSHEYVYFASVDSLTNERFERLYEDTWERGLSKVNAGPGHHYTDVTLVIVADEIEPEVMKAIKKVTKQVSYNHMIWGFSNLRLIAIESTTGSFAHNRQGKSLKKLVSKLLSK